MTALAVLATIAAILLLLDSLRGVNDTPHFSGDEGPATRADVAKARTRLSAVPVADSEWGYDGYDRAEFGNDWVDTTGDGCPTRHTVLARDLESVETTDGCRVRSGVLDDPYTGERLRFTSGDPQAVQIDHVVPLALAWRMGAAEWDRDRRVRFANDPHNLLATDGPTNMDKGDSGPGEWQPYEGYQCSYAVTYIDTTHRYELSLTPRDRDGLEQMLGRCG